MHNEAGDEDQSKDEPDHRVGNAFQIARARDLVNCEYGCAASRSAPTAMLCPAATATTVAHAAKTAPSGRMKS